MSAIGRDLDEQLARCEGDAAAREAAAATMHKTAAALHRAGDDLHGKAARKRAKAARIRRQLAELAVTEARNEERAREAVSVPAETTTEQEQP